MEEIQGAVTLGDLESCKKDDEARGLVDTERV